jgi:hypothetical protein
MPKVPSISTRVSAVQFEVNGSKSVVDRRRDFSEAAGVGEHGRSVADVLPGDGIEIRCPADVFSACIHVKVQLRPVPLKSSQRLVTLVPPNAESVVVELRLPFAFLTTERLSLGAAFLALGSARCVSPLPEAKVPATKHTANAAPTCLMRISPPF